MEPATLLDAVSFHRRCTNGGVEPFDDGRYVGLRQTWTECGGGTYQLTHVAARSVDDSYTAFVRIGTPAPDDPAGELILASFGAVPRRGGNATQTVQASTDFAAFADWVAPGATARVMPAIDPSVLLANYTWPSRGCTDTGVRSYHGAGGFSGLVQTWTDCTDSNARFVVLALTAPDEAATVLIDVKLLDTDDTPLVTILASLQLATATS